MRNAEFGQPVGWDYHVISVVRQTENEPWQVFDLDTVLGFPVPMETYLKESFAPNIREDYLPWFRTFPSDFFAQSFSSDREHMRNQDGTYLQPPPDWSPILNGELTLKKCLDESYSEHPFRTLKTFANAFL